MLYHCNTFGPDIDAFKVAFKKCHDLAIKSGTNKISIIVHIKSQFSEGIYSDIFGEEFVKVILKNPVILKKVTVELLTEKTARSKIIRNPILACHISSEFLSKLIPNKCDIVFLPWQEDELENFIKKYQSEEIPINKKSGA